MEPKAKIDRAHSHFHFSTRGSKYFRVETFKEVPHFIAVYGDGHTLNLDLSPTQFAQLRDGINTLMDALPVCIQCPVCGKWVLEEETVKCAGCGKQVCEDRCSDSWYTEEGRERLCLDCREGDEEAEEEKLRHRDYCASRGVC